MLHVTSMIPFRLSATLIVQDVELILVQLYNCNFGFRWILCCWQQHLCITRESMKWYCALWAPVLWGRLHLVIVLIGGVFQAWMEVSYAFPDTSNQPETNHEEL
jgi:hypothetical protein